MRTLHALKIRYYELFATLCQRDLDTERSSRWEIITPETFASMAHRNQSPDGTRLCVSCMKTPKIENLIAEMVNEQT